jgi:hypothetical protein
MTFVSLLELYTVAKTHFLVSNLLWLQFHGSEYCDVSLRSDWIKAWNNHQLKNLIAPKNFYFFPIHQLFVLQLH